MKQELHTKSYPNLAHHFALASNQNIVQPTSEFCEVGDCCEKVYTKVWDDSSEDLRCVCFNHISSFKL